MGGGFGGGLGLGSLEVGCSLSGVHQRACMCLQIVYILHTCTYLRISTYTLYIYVYAYVHRVHTYTYIYIYTCIRVLNVCWFVLLLVIRI